MNRFLKFTLLSLICFLSNTIYAFQKIDSILEASGYYTQETLAIFDIDDVLIQPADPAFQVPNIQRHHKIVKNVMEALTHEQIIVFLNLTNVRSDSVIIEEDVHELMHTLRENNISTIALTACATGFFAKIPSMETWRISRLEQCGFDFSENSPRLDCIFTEIPPFQGNHSSYQKGVLFCNSPALTKGDVLVAFLKRTQLQPKRIVFVDDRQSNLDNVQTALREFDDSIEYVGLQYLGAEQYPSLLLDQKSFEAKWQALASEVKNLP